MLVKKRKPGDLLYILSIDRLGQVAQSERENICKRQQAKMQDARYKLPCRERCDKILLAKMQKHGCNDGLSPSGKAKDFDSFTRRFESGQPSWCVTGEGFPGGGEVFFVQ